MHTDTSLTLKDSAEHLIEEGAAAMEATRWMAPVPRNAIPRRESFDVIVIGGGQAGLAVGFHLAQTGLRFVILDANERVGDSWRGRWDSLRLFTPAKLDGLVGMPFPAPANSFPTKDQMADYLAAYASRFHLPVRNGVRVQRLFRRGTRYVVRSGALEFEAEHVVVAMAGYQRPKLPIFAGELSAELRQLHSSDYRNLGQLKPGGVLIAGAGNSGAELAMEAVRGGHPTWMAGNDAGHIPYRPESFLGRNLLAPLVLRFVFHRLLTIRTPLGRKLRPKILSKGTPLIRVKPVDLATAGVHRVPRVVGAQDGQPLLADGRMLSVANVIWCSGYHPGFDWIDLPIFADEGTLLHQGGVVERAPGLYFVGLTFLYAMSSSMIHGVSRDAERIVKTIEARRATARAAAAMAHLPVTAIR
jgi:putative flavoprotein involved in K+ transport